MKNIKVFRSRISVLVIIFLLILFTPILISMLLDKVYQGIVGLGGIVFLIIISFSRTRYIISGEELLIKIFFIPCGKVNIAKITSVERSYNPISSAAASLKRLQINYNNGRFLLISPIDEPIFIEELKKINPTIIINIFERNGKWRIQDWDI